jgi:RNA polymerase sigma-70 factor (ECF subfamily)
MTHHPLAEVFGTHGAQLRKTARRILGDAQRAEDLLQDACLKALQSPSPPMLEIPLSYAHRMVRNMAIDHQRRCRLEGALFCDPEAAEQVCSPASCPERQAIGRQCIERVAQAVGRLPERQRRVFELHRLEGLTQREIAGRLGMSAGTVNGELSEALARCRSAVEDV